VSAAAALMFSAVLAGIPSHATDAHCLRALMQVPEESVPDPKSFAPAPCTNRSTAPAFWYDRAAGTARLARGIDPGEVVPRFPGFGANAIRPGEKLKLVVTIGRVRIERDVEALQEARAGSRLFVRDRDGELTSVRFVPEAR
jgi:hypothetical protein